jgi:REP element-mobilizing transposase RayT
MEYNYFMFDHQDILFAEKYKKSSSRNPHWDYSSPAIYFVTFCTYRHNYHFGRVVGNEFILSDIGLIVNEELHKTFKIRKNLKMHDYVIMPNPVHLLFEILYVDEACLTHTEKSFNLVETPRWGVSKDTKSNIHKPQIASTKWKPNSVSSIINQIKSISTKRINKIPRLFGWQSRYYDEIIKDEKHYWAVKNYIKNNVRNWSKDEYNRDVKIGV